MMTDAELSRELALALGYAPESVRVVRPWPPEPVRNYCEVYRITNDMGPYWRKFDYRSPDVCLPLIKWLMVEHYATLEVCRIDNRRFGVFISGDGWYWHNTLEEAVARAVIAARKG